MFLNSLSDACSDLGSRKPALGPDTGVTHAAVLPPAPATDLLSCPGPDRSYCHGTAHNSAEQPTVVPNHSVSELPGIYEEACSASAAAATAASHHPHPVSSGNSISAELERVAQSVGPSVLEAAIAAYKQEKRKLWKVWLITAYVLFHMSKICRSTCNCKLSSDANLRGSVGQEGWSTGRLGLCKFTHVLAKTRHKS